MASKKNIKLIEDPIKRGFAIFSGFIFICSIGYGIGSYLKGLEFKLEKYELNLMFETRLQKQIINCEKEKQSLSNQKVENLERVVKELSKNLNNERK